MDAKMPSLKDTVFLDLEREFGVTRKVLERLPEREFGWKPHEKSMSLGRLAMHVATLPDWMQLTLDEPGLDMASSRRPRLEPENSKDLLDTFDNAIAKVRASVDRLKPEVLAAAWTVRNGAQVMTSQPRAKVYRIWCMNHLVHHRAQLCVYLRLLNVPVPAVYFNSADEPDWVFA
jgi:uncharacterized damage-inducible protein DinB